MRPFVPRHVYIDEAVLDEPVTKTILTRVDKGRVEVIGDIPPVIKAAWSRPDPWREGKKDLLVTRQKGEVIKACPGTPEFLCCNYYVMNQIINCTMDCSYCFLQSYLTNPLIVVNVNIEEILDELDQKILDHPGRFWRIGTGELSDSLSLDHLTGMARLLIPFFEARQNIFFEFKTKTDHIDTLIEMAKIKPPKNIMISWTLNTQDQIAGQEYRTASLIDRLEAARKCQASGYPVAFHFDPLIHSPDWRKSYASVIEEIYKRLDKRLILWFSLGTFRFSPKLKKIIKTRFPKNPIIYAEMVKGEDGKIRYPRTLRIEMYKFMVEALGAHDPDVVTYLCMESPQVWESVLGWSPSSPIQLDALLHKTYSKKTIDAMPMSV